MRPMLATRGDRVPSGPEWTHEVKWDGMRILADATSEAVRLTSRNENDVTVSFPELHGLAGRDLLLDGEVVAFDAADGGRPSFARLAERMHVGRARRAAALAEVTPVTFLVFDVLRLDGVPLDSRPLAERRTLLESLGLADVSWQVPAAYDDGLLLQQATRDQGLEGVVSKRLDSAYRFGARTAAWLKFPHRHRSSWVVGGWRPETGSRERLGAVLVGAPVPGGGLRYRGRVGSGIAGRTGPVLAAALAPLARSTPPFVDEVPAVDRAGTFWVEPTLVVDVESLGFSGQGRLRQPAYVGLRADLAPDDVTGEP